jgi:hypothetical protein
MIDFSVGFYIEIMKPPDERDRRVMRMFIDSANKKAKFDNAKLLLLDQLRDKPDEFLRLKDLLKSDTDDQLRASYGMVLTSQLIQQHENYRELIG